MPSREGTPESVAGGPSQQGVSTSELDVITQFLQRHIHTVDGLTRIVEDLSSEIERLESERHPRDTMHARGLLILENTEHRISTLQIDLRTNLLETIRRSSIGEAMHQMLIARYDEFMDGCFGTRSTLAALMRELREEYNASPSSA